MSLSQLIDDYIEWLIAWHRLSAGGERVLTPIDPPVSFHAWHASAAQDPSVEKIAATQDQLHRLARLVLMKTPEAEAVARKDDDSVTAKYLELMQGLRRLERAFAAAASGLDLLTGLQARAGAMKEIERELQRFMRSGRLFCVAAMDIDHFKKINDTHGHDAGDRVLAAVANSISRNLRAHDDAYRMGGEEFLLCLKDADGAAGQRVLERLRNTLAQHPVVLADGAIVAVTASFGLALPRMDDKAETLFKRADAALYRAKNEGRDRVVTAD